MVIVQCFFGVLAWCFALVIAGGLLRINWEIFMLGWSFLN